LIFEQILIQNSKVEFAGYSVPHPSEPIVHIRVQTNEPTTAMQALQESCETLHDQCEYVLRQLESKLPEVRRDSSALQAKMEEMLEEDDDEDDDEEDGEEDAEEVFMEE
jgi:DNA-directed RNA polymerase I and III subunit RPAC2